MVVIRAELALAVGAATTSNRTASNDFEFVDSGIIRLIAKRTATASSTMQANLKINGVSLGGESNGATIPYLGATANLIRDENVVIEQPIKGGKVSLYFTDTVAASTVDYILEFIAA